MNSIKLKLLIILTASIISATLITIAGVYSQIKNETNTLFDYQLKEVAEVFLNTSSIPWDKFNNKNDKEEIDSDFAVVVFDNLHKQSYSTGITEIIQYPKRLGYNKITISKEIWHTYSLSNEKRTVMFLQPEIVREKFAVSTAFSSIIPFLLILPIFAILIWIILRNGFKPLEVVQDGIAKLDEYTLEPLHFSKIPKELLSLIKVINKTIFRLKNAIEMRKNFVADAAHELRTPLSVLKIQLELVHKATDEMEKKLLLYKLNKGIDRSSRLVEQLLKLSRQENYRINNTYYENTDLAQLVSDVLVESLPLAEIKNIDFEVNKLEKIILYIDKNEIETVISNLIDNAIGYTQNDGLVTLSLFNQQDMIVLEKQAARLGVKKAL